MRKRLLAVLLAMTYVLSFSSCSPEEPLVPEFKSEETEEAQRPEIGENYYGYVNFDYLSEGQIPYDKTSFGTFDHIQEELENDISDIIKQCAEKDAPSDVFEKYVKEIYEQYMNTEAREAAGTNALMVLVAKVEGCKTVDEFVDIMGEMYQQYGVSSMVRFYVLPDMHDATEYALTIYNLNTCGNMKENFTKTDAGQEQVGDLTRDTLIALKVDETEARKRAENVVKMLNDIMVATMDSSDDPTLIEKHYNPYSKEELGELYSNIDTNKLLQAFGYDVDRIIVHDVSQTEKVNEYLTDEHLRELKDYALACTMYQYSSSLPPSYMEKFSDKKNDLKEMEKNAKIYVNNLLDDEVGVLYGRYICTDEVMSSAEKMLSDLKNSCRDRINESERLSDDSKSKLLEKLDNMIFLLGYNKDYTSPFEITPAKDGGNLLQNAIAVNAAEIHSEMHLLTHKTDRNTWGMLSTTVNAVYNPNVNTVTIPAAMLSKAFYDPDFGEFKNLGMLGYVIAHEMNHAFDSNGIKFDKNGTLSPDWIDEKDIEKYETLQEEAIEYYSSYKILDIYNIKGDLTLSENLADLGAVQCIVGITDDKEELEQIFEGVATGWATLMVVSDVVMQLSGDVHSPNEARVNAVLSSVDKFYKVYDIKETDKMYVAPEDRIKVW